MKISVLILLMGMIGSTGFAGTLTSACSTCVKELPIHLVGGFFSIFSGKQGKVKPFVINADDKVLSLASFREAFQENGQKAFATKIDVKKARSSGAELDYEIDGSLSLPDGSVAKVLRHTYLYQSETEAFYLFELQDAQGRPMKLIGDASDPLTNPVFWGIVYDTDDKAKYAIQIWGRTGAEAEQTLQRIERFVLEKERNPSSKSQQKKPKPRNRKGG